MKRRFATFILVTGAALALPSLAAAQLPGIQTPGAKAGVSEADVCSGDFESTVKPLSPWQVGQALSRYGKRLDDKSFVVDHLIPVALGGTNDPDNLWPQPIQKQLGPDAKDELEARLKTMVCSKSMPLKAAQDAIKKDWVKAYKQYVVNAN
jgi:hypothetical protein